MRKTKSEKIRNLEARLEQLRRQEAAERKRGLAALQALLGTAVLEVGDNDIDRRCLEALNGRDQERAKELLEAYRRQDAKV